MSTSCPPRTDAPRVNGHAVDSLATTTVYVAAREVEVRTTPAVAAAVREELGDDATTITQTGVVVHAVAGHLSPADGAGLLYQHAQHRLEEAQEAVARVAADHLATKSEVARAAGVTRQTLDRWLGQWQRVKPLID